jgi:ATP/ADP translocase/HEAT repeat protein
MDVRLNTQAKLLALLNIEPGEEKIVLLMLLHSFFIGSARIFTRSGAYALFLVQFTANDLPKIYIGIGVIVTLLSLIYLRLSERLSFPKLLSANVIFLILSLLGFRFGLQIGAFKWLVFFLPIWYEVLWTLTNLEYWNLAGRLFNVRQGKRLFGLIGASEQVAIIAGGFLVPIVVGVIGTTNLFVLSALSMVGVLITIFYTSSSYASRLTAPKETLPVKKQKNSLNLLQNPYILAIFGLFALDIIAYFTIDNIFYAQAEIHFPTEVQLAGFVGVFFGFCGLLTLIVRTFLTGHVISRYGVRTGLLLTPLLLFVSGLLAATTGTFLTALVLFFWLVALMRSIDMVFIEAIDLPTINVLYQPLPAAKRVQVQAMVEGIIYSLSIGLTGVALWLFTSLAKPSNVQLLYVVLGILIVWMIVAVRLGNMYPQALVRALARRRLDSVELSLDDGSSIPILLHELKSTKVGSVLYAVSLLESMKPEALVASIPYLLDHPEPAVRQDVLQRLERLHMVSASKEICKRISVESSPAVLGAALRALASLDSQGSYECVSAYVDHPHPQVRRGALVGLLLSGGIEAVVAAGKKLDQFARSADPAERVLAAQILSDVADSNFYQLLLPLLSDKAVQVRRAALQAAGQVKNPRLWAVVLEALKDGTIQAAAFSALANGGEAVVPEVIRAFDQEGQNRAALVDLCGRIGLGESAAWLKGKMDYPDPGIRLYVLRSLARCGYHAQGGEASYIKGLITGEVASAAGMLAIIADLDTAKVTAELVQDALQHAVDHAQERIFYLLSFLYDSQAVLAARDNLSLAAPERKAYAVEAIDVLVSKDLKKVLLPLLSSLPAAQKVQRLSEFYPQPRQNFEGRLQEIISAPNGAITQWTKTCAIYTVGRLRLGGLRQMVQDATSTPDALIRETACWTISRLDQEKIAGFRPQLSQESKNGEIIPIRRVTMLSTVEKVIALKKASIFTAIPDEILVDVAELLNEVTLIRGETIFEKGDFGDCMYIIVDGEVRVHDGEDTLNHLAEGDVFGEMAVLDAEPRLASVTAVSETRLLRLAQEVLFDLMDEKPEVGRGIIQVLSRHLRARIQDLNAVRSREENR